MSVSSTEPLGLSAAQRQEFDSRGFVRLPAAIARADIDAMANRLWATLAARHGLKRDEPETWSVERPFGLQSVQASGAFHAMASPAVAAALDALMGRDAWSRPATWGLPLVCFPQRQRQVWTVPHQSWHLDGPAEPGGHIRIGRVFALLAPLAAGGGGTVMAEGSHRLVRRLVERHGGTLSSSEIRKRLKAEHPWFGELMAAGGDPSERVSRLMATPTPADGVCLRVTEMVGEPGDVWLMHPDMLHAGAPNVLASPRLVLTQFVYPKP